MAYLLNLIQRTSKSRVLVAKTKKWGVCLPQPQHWLAMQLS